MSKGINTIKKSLLVFLLLTTIFACKKDKETDLSFDIVGKYGQEAFQLNETYATDLGQYLRFIELKFYISNINLIQEDDEVVQIEEVILYNFANPQTISLNIPEGTYKSISFDIGLNEELNASDPNNLDVEHPLSYAQNTHWDWTSQYRFIMLDGRIDTVQTENFSKTFSYHTGFNDLFRQRTITQNIDAVGNGDLNLELVLQVDKIFDGANSINVFENNTSHSLTETATQITDNFVDALSLKIN